MGTAGRIEGGGIVRVLGVIYWHQRSVMVHVIIDYLFIIDCIAHSVSDIEMLCF